MSIPRFRHGASMGRVELGESSELHHTLARIDQTHESRHVPIKAGGRHPFD